MAGPLTPQDLEEINKQLANLRQALQEIARAEAAGIDVADQKREATDLMERLTKIKQAYFPNK